MKTKKILLVEDNGSNRKLFESQICQNFQFTSACNAVEALELLSAVQYDLIFIDHKIPSIEKIISKYKISQNILISCPIIALTAYQEESEKQKYFQMGFDDVINGPIQTDHFLNIIQHCVEISADSILHDSKNEELILDKKIVAQLMKFNSHDRIKKIYGDFVLESKEIYLDIQRSGLGTSSKQIFEKLHILKGNSGTLGANKIFSLSKKLEKALKIGNFGGFEYYISVLKKEIDFFEQIIKEETNFTI